MIQIWPAGATGYAFGLPSERSRRSTTRPARGTLANPRPNDKANVDQGTCGCKERDVARTNCQSSHVQCGSRAILHDCPGYLPQLQGALAIRIDKVTVPRRLTQCGTINGFGHIKNRAPETRPRH